MGFWEIIKLIPQILSIFKAVMGFIRDLKEKQNDEALKQVEKGVENLEKAKTRQERKDALKDIARGSGG